MNYSVFWVPDAEQELAAIWLFPLQYVIQCVKQRTFLIIRAQFPDHRTTQLVFLRIARFDLSIGYIVCHPYNTDLSSVY